ncbi:hypothetical protein PR048_030220 [Dryococelus australis]|uniref:Endonuclease/exonuclease/phosphatase domain-containing protein n=1 Tax=Dryococelus australis TaxID=614101 RepID=A0ABQ9GC83_9NEOP|nr:hypothetical protein PR048_030220 [Dryococelus australis]
MSRISDKRDRLFGPSIRVCVVNVEGISLAKADYLNKLCTELKIDILMVQETHASSSQELNSIGKVSGSSIIGAEFHPKHGTAVFCRSSFPTFRLVESTTINDISITVKVNDLSLVNVYKPLITKRPDNVLKTYHHPALYCIDFNSQSSVWGYQSDDENGEKLTEWAMNEELKLVYDPKQRETFHSARWNRDYNPDLCFVSSNVKGIPLNVTIIVLSEFPNSQHRPVIIEIGLKVPLVKSGKRLRWNFRKANWDAYAKVLDDAIRFIPSTISNSDKFVGIVIKMVKKHIHRGYRKAYIPCWHEDTDRLYEEFKDSSNPQTAEELLMSLDTARRERWTKTVSGLSFSHSSRKYWSLLHKIGAATPANPNDTKIHPNKVARRIAKMSKVAANREFTRTIIVKYSLLRIHSPKTSYFARPFEVDEIISTLSKIKLGKAAGFDGMYPEFLTPEQAGFRNGRICTDQVLTLTNFIKEGFRCKLKTDVVFVDLTAAYDTVWKKGLLYKLLKVIPCIITCDLICNLLSNKFLQVYEQKE